MLARPGAREIIAWTKPVRFPERISGNAGGCDFVYIAEERTMDVISLLGATVGLGFAAGLRLYATVLTLGLAIRFHLLTLPDSMKSLEVLAHPLVIGAAAVMYVAEFVSDKIPWFDSLWDSVHTVIRPLGAAAIAATAFGQMEPLTQTLLVLLTGGVALSSHASKAATRLAVNQSPEPFSNIAMSLLGDFLAPAGIWFAFAHPLLMLVAVGVFLVVFLWLASKIWKMLSGGFKRIRQRSPQPAA